MNRKPAVAGQFYPSDPLELKRELEGYFANALPRRCNNVRAVIAPHAGYLFSGQVAASGFNQIESGVKYKRVFLIGSSHTTRFEGASLYCEGNFKMPYGSEIVDVDLAKKLINKYPGFFVRDSQPHISEHSLEVQLPFLHYLLKPGYKIVPVIIGSSDNLVCKTIAGVLKSYLKPDNLFVISSDFSHYPSYSHAIDNDKRTMDAIVTNNPNTLINTIEQNRLQNIRGLYTSLCGFSSVLMLMYMTSGDEKFLYKPIHYLNSGDNKYFGEKDRVVGYWAIAVEERSSSQIFLTDSEKETLKRIAKEAIDFEVTKQRGKGVRREEITKGLRIECGVFVTIYRNGRLRGCIGNTWCDKPIYESVARVARLSASSDYRFPPLERSELSDIVVEISLLSEPHKIEDISQIVPGRDGILIKKGTNSGLFLPQVAKERNWNTQEMLGHCSRDKAGIGWDGWRDAEIFTFTSTVIK